ncbi:iron-sulfur cluster assembly scaffold protein [Candidatus Nomurabacteria bacterium]|nr:iron-sulfur cluster assembly scaffold protein [Candidatus Nomurabacteria bacterium]
MSDIEQMYKEVILDLYRSPLHAGHLDHPSHEASASNPSCGDVCHIELLVKNGKVIEAAHQTSGCAISTAGVSLLVDHLIEKDIKELEKLADEDVLQMLGVPITHNRLKCALLGLRPLKEIIQTMNNVR